MRILMLSDVYFPRINGVSTSIQTFRRQFGALGTRCCSSPRLRAGTEPEPASCACLRARCPWTRGSGDGGQSRAGLEPALRERRFDLIHIQTPFVAHYAGVALSKRLGVPRVETYHTFFEEYLHHYVPVVPAPGRAPGAALLRAQCNDLDAVVVPSRAMRECCANTAFAHPWRSSHRHRAGTPERRERRGVSAAPRHPAATPVLVHVGRVAFEKNIDFLLRMLVRVRAECPTCSWSSRARASSGHLQRLARRWAWSATCFSWATLTAQRPARLLLRRRRLRVRVAHGDPGAGAVGGNGAGFAGRVHRRHGHARHPGAGPGAVVAREDETEFAARVAELLQDPAMRARLSREARSYATEWSAPRMAARMLELYARVLDAAGQRLPLQTRLGKTASL